MYRTNCPSVKNYKRKVALENLEKHLGMYKDGANPNYIPITPEFQKVQVTRVEKEIATLKARITNA